MDNPAIELVALDSLVPYANNPKQHPPEQVDLIAGSIREFGFLVPIVIDQERGIIAGHGRYEAARKLGLAEVPCIQADYLTPAQIKAFRLADNKIAESPWDEKALGVELEGLKALKFDLAIAGFDEPQDEPPDAPEPQTDKAEELLKKWKVERGQVWAVGQHRLMCGDSTADADVAALIPSTCDLVVTSPPYNSDIDYASHDDDMPIDEYLAFIAKVMAHATRHLSDGRYVAWNVGVTPKSKHFEHARLLETSGLVFYRQIVWAKAGVVFPIWQYTTGPARKYHPNYCHELIYLFTKGPPEPGDACEVADEYSKDVWTVNQCQATRGIPGITDGRRPPKPGVHGGSKAAAHPAAFPVGIPAGVIRHLTAPGESTYDPFIGAGTTMVAAEQLGRICYGMEIEPKYVAVTLERMADMGLEPKLVP